MKYLYENESPQQHGYRLFFTNGNKSEDLVAMQFARATKNRNDNFSSYEAVKDIDDAYFPGAMHFGSKITRDPNKKFFDIDLKSAYPTWLINYKRGNFNYKVGGVKRYYPRYSYFSSNIEGLRVYRISFVVKTGGAEKSRIYRHWILKSTKVKNMIITNEYISGIISIPDIEGLVNKFLDDIYFYEERDVEILNIIVATGYNNVYINENALADALAIKNRKDHPLREEYKKILNSSTGYLAIADKIMYFTMVNHIRSEVLKLIDAIDDWNLKRPNLPLEVVACNTDGITVYATEKAEYAILDIIEWRLNRYSVFTWDLKDIYEWKEANITPNDVRKKVS